jgi:Asp-tRNA(Asn)/Glu-tRNA(Gln) amidotransferase A subunit family amidase
VTLACITRSRRCDAAAERSPIALNGKVVGATAVSGDSPQVDEEIAIANPWNVERTLGGSSGGAAAAIASGMTPFDIGTDLSGSIRIPSAYCGVFGLKPTEKRVSLNGVVPDPRRTPRSVRSMACVGPIARTVDDLALIFRIIAGPDASDTEVQPVPVSEVPAIDLEMGRAAVSGFHGHSVSALRTGFTVACRHQRRRLLDGEWPQRAVQLQRSSRGDVAVGIRSRRFTDRRAAGGQALGRIAPARHRKGSHRRNWSIRASTRLLKVLKSS